MMQKNKYIAFVCTGNTCRSPMAEAIFNQKAEERGLAVRARSFGLAAVSGMPASKHAVTVCAEIGVDLSTFRSHFIYDYDLSDFDRLYCMSEEHVQILTQSVGVSPERVVALDIADPYGSGVEIYRLCREMIQTAVEQILHDYAD
ncbi:MAG: low molecular weight phosphatase family protein [Ruminococcus sp.]|nr:low molecular weight phosphatase family protein [Ruminococcus sp.]